MPGKILTYGVPISRGQAVHQVGRLCVYFIDWLPFLTGRHTSVGIRGAWIGEIGFRDGILLGYYTDRNVWKAQWYVLIKKPKMMRFKKG